MIFKFPKISLALFLLLALGQMAQAGADLRRDALTAANWAIEAGQPEALADAITLYLQHGGSIAADDPFSVAALLETLSAMPEGAPLADAIIARRSRGQLGGAQRTDVFLDPGANHQEEVVFVGDEWAVVEGQLWKDAKGADIDMEIRDADGVVLAADTGPQTGVLGRPIFVEFYPDSCVTATIRMTNLGQARARVALLIPLSSQDRCR